MHRTVSSLKRECARVSAGRIDIHIKRGIRFLPEAETSRFRSKVSEHGFWRVRFDAAEGEAYWYVKPKALPEACRQNPA